jgi:hypothetical protein
MLFTTNTWGVVYFSGVDGIKSSVFDAEGCGGCHDFTLAYSNFQAFANSYSGSNDTTRRQSFITDIYNVTSQNPGTSGFMPPSASSRISVSQRQKFLDWSSAGALNHAAPTLATSSAVTNKGKAAQTSKNSAYFTVSASVSDNGIDATDYNFNYGQSTSSFLSSVNQQVSGSGTVGQILTGLECGTVYYFRVQASNLDYGLSVGDWQNTTTDACNTPPVIQNNLSAITATEDQNFSLDINATDTQSDNIIYGLTQNPTGMTINTSTGLIDWTPAEGTVAGNYSVAVTVTAQDTGYDDAIADSESFSVSVTAVNDSPVISNDPVVSTNMGVLYSNQIIVIDPDINDSFTYSLSGKPSGMEISGSGLITWTPGSGVLTSGPVTLLVTDAGGLSDNLLFTISVFEFNTPPTMAVIGDANINEGEAFSYEVEVTDPNDLDIENQIDFTLTTPPSGMTISGVGVISWTPSEGQDGTFIINVSAADGGENDSLAATQQFSITVNEINNSPKLILALTAQTLNETEILSIDVSSNFNDVDTANADLNWSLSAAPDGMSISSLGLITWDTPEGSASIYTITVLLADDGSDGSQAATGLLTVNVVFEDSDSDTIADFIDNCPDVANVDQANNENDAQGDICDLDDDNDNIPDTVEIALGLDPLNGADGLLDIDSDGVTNAEEYLLCAAEFDAACDRILNDTIPPVITTNGDMVVESSGYFTPIKLTASAVDGLGSPRQVTPDKLGPFRPGAHVVTWTSRDTAGNTASLQQNITVLPQVRFGGSKQIGEGKSILVPLSLSGDSPSYPVTVNYLVSGSSDENDHDITSGQIEISSGTTANLAINIVDDGLVEVDETLIISLSSASNNVALMDNLVYQIQISVNNLAPEIQLIVEQSGESVPVVYQDNGVFRISALAEDGNGDVLTYDWSSSDTRLNLTGNADANVSFFDIDPTTLSPDFYHVATQVNDGRVTVSQQLGFTLIAIAPVLNATDTDGDGISDQDEGLLDEDKDGVLDYLDPVNDSQQLHKNLAGSDSQDLMKTEPGFRLKVGQLSIKNRSNGAKLGSQYIASIADSVTGKVLTGDILDFEIQGTSELNSMAKIVIPLSNPIAEGAEYWKLDGDSWYKFNENGNDYIASSARVDGICPEPSSDSYTAGLTAFNACLLLVIEDGGPNDSDGTLNGIVRDPGSLAVPETESFIVAKNQLTAPTKSPSGAGAFNYLFIIGCIFLLSIIRIRHRKTTHVKALY